MRRRETDYRYPAALTIAGGPRGTPEALPNRTIYPYRYLARTHHLDFWTRPDEQLADLVRQVLRSSGQALASEGKRVRVSPRLDEGGRAQPGRAAGRACCPA